MYVNGSYTLTWNSSVFSARDTASAVPTPNTRPTRPYHAQSVICD